MSIKPTGSTYLGGGLNVDRFLRLYVLTAASLAAFADLTLNTNGMGHI